MIFSPVISIILDLLRFGLAALVLAAHLSQRYFQTSWPDLTPYASIAVGSFFVLSGLVIRGLEQRALPSLREFYADRASRLLSVTLIALLLTVLSDFISYRVATDFYLANWGGGANYPATRLVANVTLFSQPWGFNAVPFSNSPFWSLGYESGFYVLWGAAAYARRQAGSTWLTLLAAVAYGPQVVLMMLFWYLGVSLYDQTEGAAGRPGGARQWIAITAAILLALLFAPITQERLLHGRAPFELIGLYTGHASSRVMLGAIATYAVLLPLLRAARTLASVSAPPRLLHAARFLGEMTFPLYLIHFPLLVLARSLGIYDPDSSPQKCLVALGIAGVAALIVPLGDWVKRKLRGVARRYATDQPNARQSRVAAVSAK